MEGEASAHTANGRVPGSGSGALDGMEWVRKFIGVRQRASLAEDPAFQDKKTGGPAKALLTILKNGVPQIIAGITVNAVMRLLAAAAATAAGLAALALAALTLARAALAALALARAALAFFPAAASYGCRGIDRVRSELV